MYMIKDFMKCNYFKIDKTKFENLKLLSIRNIFFFNNCLEILK